MQSAPAPESKSYYAGINIRRARDMHGWSQEYFASLIGMSQGNLSNIESNKQSVAWDTLSLIAEKLGTSAEALSETDSMFVFNIEKQQGSANGNHNVVKTTAKKKPKR